MADLTFHSRTRPILGDEGIHLLEQPLVTIAGLGGVGGGAFLALVRAGVKRFRLAENGVFDPPDMNRQAGAFGSSMDRPKLDVYAELARSINPDVELELFPDGVGSDNLEAFICGSAVYLGVIDVEKGAEVKALTPELIKKYDVPLFTCGAIGFGALMVNHHPGGMMPDAFWHLAQEKSPGGVLLPAALLSHFAPESMHRLQEGYAGGVLPTTPVGGLASNALLANEVLAYLLAETGLVERQPVFAPHYVAMDFMNLSMTVADIST